MKSGEPGQGTGMVLRLIFLLISLGLRILPKRSEKKDDWNWRLNTRDGMTSNVGELVMKCSRVQTHWNHMLNLVLPGIIIFHFHRMSWIEMRI
jgi:hypothetical protein